MCTCSIRDCASPPRYTRTQKQLILESWSNISIKTLERHLSRTGQSYFSFWRFLYGQQTSKESQNGWRQNANHKQRVLAQHLSLYRCQHLSTEQCCNVQPLLVPELRVICVWSIRVFWNISCHDNVAKYHHVSIMSSMLTLYFTI